MIVRIQKTVRMFLAVTRHKPRYKGIIKVRSLQSMIMELTALACSLKKDADSVQKQVKSLDLALEDLVRQIKTTLMKQGQIDLAYNDLFNKLTTQMNDIQKRLKSQKEEDRIKKIQEQMQLERKKKEDEERRKKEAEEERKRKIEVEARLRREAEEFERLRKEEEEASRLLLEKMKAEEIAAEQARKAQEDQERRDYDLALRLSSEGNNSLKVKDPSKVVVIEETQVKKSSKAPNKNTDLRALKYDELRNLINTSTDVELLGTCRAEFHRRLKVYHDWRKKNMQNKTNKTADQRAPVDVIKNAEMPAIIKQQQQPPAKKSAAATARPQRFFRVSFARPSDQYRNADYKKVGWWYAHFDGEWIARQLEIHANGVLLLVSGKDDMDMCELSLTQTGLVRRSGAEIDRKEFDSEWTKQGGTVVEDFSAKQKK